MAQATETIGVFKVILSDTSKNKKSINAQIAQYLILGFLPTLHE